MYEFKVGDRVKYLGDTEYGEYWGEWSGEDFDVVGKIGLVVGFNNSGDPVVELDDFKAYTQIVHPNNLSLITEDGGVKKTITLPVNLPKEVVLLAEEALEEQLIKRAEAAWCGELDEYPSEETHILAARAVYNAIVKYYQENI